MSVTMSATAVEERKLYSDRLLWLAAILTPLVLGPLWVILSPRFPVSQRPFAATLAGFVSIVVSFATCYTDLRWHRIPNWLTYAAALWGVAINVAGTIAGPSGEFLGAVGLANALMGFAALFTLFLVIFSFTGGGAGDVKLAGAIGALLGLDMGIEAILYAFAAAGIWVGAWAILTIGPLKLLQVTVRRLGNMILPRWFGPATDEDRRLLAMPVALGPFFAIGTLIVVLEWNHTIEQYLKTRS